MSEGERMRIPLREWRPKDWLTPARRCSPVIGRITQLTEMGSIPATDIRSLGSFLSQSRGHSPEEYEAYSVYVYRQDGQANMSLTRIDPFQHEHVDLSELEMRTVMQWAYKMHREGIGSFVPSDGGWFWRRK